MENETTLEQVRSVRRVRRANLTQLAEMYGKQRLSEMLGYSNPSYLSHMIGPNPTRYVSEETARRVETALGLKPLWLDSLVDAKDMPIINT